MRGYVMLEEDELEDELEDEISRMKLEIREELIQKLVSEWNELNSQIERRSWRDRERMDDVEDFHAERIRDLRADAYASKIDASKEEALLAQQEAEDAYNQARELEERKPYLRREVIEQLLGDCGARMMRPYEHWNEDERYMEWSENRHSGDEY